MKTVRDKCQECGQILGGRIFNLNRKQEGFTICYVKIPCKKCGFETLVKTNERL